MKNEITQVGVPTTLSESMEIGKLFFESGLFPDVKSAAQAVVKIQSGAEIGVPAFAAIKGIHIIQGTPTMGAGLIASRVKGSGKYNYEIVELNEKVCSIDFYEGKKKIGNSKFTIEDAKKQSTKNLDKFPKNMLFARAISNGARWYTPDIFNGSVYTPEDIYAGEVPEQVVEDATHTVIEELPEFPKDKFEAAKKAGATPDKIRERYTLTSEVEAEYLAYVGTKES